MIIILNKKIKDAWATLGCSIFEDARNIFSDNPNLKEIWFYDRSNIEGFRGEWESRLEIDRCGDYKISNYLIGTESESDPHTGSVSDIIDWDVSHVEIGAEEGVFDPSTGITTWDKYNNFKHKEENG